MGTARLGQVGASQKGLGDGVSAARVLLAHDDSLSVLEGLLAEVRLSAEGRVILVGGEAGVGKTALVRAFCDAQDRKAWVVWGLCEPLRTPRP